MLKHLLLTSFVLLCYAHYLRTQSVPTVLYIPPCESGRLYSLSLQQYNAYPPLTETQVEICYTSDYYLQIDFTAEDFYIKNTYKNCNDPLYNQDVVEFFLGDYYSDPLTHYIEFEISPFSELFVARIVNKNGKIYSTTYIDCATSGIKYTASAFPEDNFWTAQAKVPFSLLMASSSEEPRFMGNFFRIDLWEYYQCIGTTNCYYYCYNPTLKNPPSFHLPQFFVEINIYPELYQ